MRKILIGILLIAMSNISLGRTASCVEGTSVVAFYNLVRGERNIDCYKDNILIEGYTEVLLPKPSGPNWAPIDYIKGYVYSNSVYASICYVRNNDASTCAFNIIDDWN